MFLGIIHGQSFILVGITTNLKHSYTSPHYNVLAGAFFVGRLFSPQVNTFQPLKQGHLSTQDTFSHPKYHTCGDRTVRVFATVYAGFNVLCLSCVCTMCVVCVH